MSMVNDLVTAIVDKLKEAPAVSQRVERVRLRALPAGASSAVVVRPIGSAVREAEMPTGQPYLWESTVVVECYTRAQQGTAPDLAVDALLDSVFARLMADPTLGGAASVLQPQAIQYDFDVDAENIVCASLQINARQITAGASL